jgi:hypothetical protein
MGIGAAMAALVAYKLINPPLGGHYVHVLAGSWLALVGSACVCAGGWAATRDDRRDVG